AGPGDGGPADRAPGDGMAAACPATAIFCDDFEGFADGATALGPKWVPYTNGGTVKVDASKPRGGNRALHVTTMANRASADILKVTADGSQVAPPVHWGRVMVWVAAVPPQAHWSFTHASGPTAANRIAQVKYSHGGQFGKLFAGYSVRNRPVNADGTFPPRGGAPDPTDPQGTIDCSKRAPMATVPLRQWVCWEWKYDATKNETQLYVNGTEQTELTVMGRGDDCVGGINPAWDGPIYFNKVIIGWEQYQDAPAQEAWFDDVAVGPDRIGCAVN
ncbi:MAG TPA: hypothetical protein VFH73_14585, partial [Polyangia bacterium]|nr:hypothetical protein [Polyangia bacterium]